MSPSVAEKYLAKIKMNLENLPACRTTYGNIAILTRTGRVIIYSPTGKRLKPSA